MRRFYPLALAALFLSATYLHAQTCPTPVSGLTYTYVTSFTASKEVYTCPNQGKAKPRTEYHWTICVWLTGQSTVELSVHPASFSVEDGCGTVDNATTASIFAVMGMESVRHAIALGHLSAPTNCSTPGGTFVSFPSCVTRTGTGDNTAFSTVGTALNRNEYTFCRSGSDTTVTYVGSSQGSNCSGGGESTYYGGGGLQ